jgi:glycosyltransferase involved in cell wall biosynthesis
MNSAKSELSASAGRAEAMTTPAPRILFCCNVALDPRLGSPKQFLEVAGAFRSQGWEVSVIGPEVWAPGHPTCASAECFGLLRDYLRREAPQWDVVQYDYLTLPFPRSDFPAGTLMTTMSTLLVHNLEPAAIPPRPRWKSRIGHLLLGWRRRRRLRDMVRRGDVAIAAADLTIVSTERDAALLAAHGHRRDKIAVVPLGITTARRPLFDAVSAEPPAGPPTIGFVGTFDPRKGMCDFPKLVARILGSIPEARFRLLGTAGMVPDAAEVLAHFPRRHRPRIEVVPRYEPDRLPAILADCSVGVFPSLVEGFGFGVLEMMAAAVPVIAYDVAGPSAMLPPEGLVPVRDVDGMAKRVVGLLSDRDGLAAARRAARLRSFDFVWEDIGRRMCEEFGRALADLRESHRSSRSG